MNEERKAATQLLEERAEGRSAEVSRAVGLVAWIGFASSMASLSLMVVRYPGIIETMVLAALGLALGVWTLCSNRGRSKARLNLSLVTVAISVFMILFLMPLVIKALNYG